MAQDSKSKKPLLAADSFIRLNLLGELSAFREALAVIARVAAVDATVLI